MYPEQLAVGAVLLLGEGDLQVGDVIIFDVLDFGEVELRVILLE